MGQQKGEGGFGLGSGRLTEMAHPEGKGQELALPSRPTGRTHQTSLDVGPVTTLCCGEPGAVGWGGCRTVLQAEGFMNSKWEGSGASLQEGAGGA